MTADKRPPKGNAAYINRLNKVRVLDRIRSEGTISRAQIVKDTGLSAPTVTRIVESLIQTEGLVTEVGMGNSSGGRPPILVKFQGEASFVIGIDLGATYIRGVLANLHAEILEERHTPTMVEEGFDAVADRVSGLIKQLIELGNEHQGIIRGIGVAVAGLINTLYDTVELSPDFNWKDVPLYDNLARRFDLPIVLDNVTRVMALGELWYGIGREFRHFVCLNFGYGVGAGIIIGGKPLYGAEGMAGEMGHVTMDKDSTVPCKCGNTGCLEALCSGQSIARWAKEALHAGHKSKICDLCEGKIDDVTAEIVAQAAEDGDELAREVLLRAAEYGGVAVATLINLFNPEAVVLGGGVMRSGDVFFEALKKTAKKRMLPRHAGRVAILHTTHGANATVMGSVSLILREVLNLSFEPA